MTHAGRLSFPIGPSTTRTLKWGGTPIKIRLEQQYSLIRPDALGTTWNIRLQFTPVIRSPLLT
jgi:hypothetical protein